MTGVQTQMKAIFDTVCNDTNWKAAFVALKVPMDKVREIIDAVTFFHGLQPNGRVPLDFKDFDAATNSITVIGHGYQAW